MRDPLEGVTPEGTITTGVSHGRIPDGFHAVIDAVVEQIGEIEPAAGVYLYGSVATGMARSGESDVDVLAVGLESTAASEVGRALSRRFADVCRGVEIGAASASDLVGDHDEAYGNRAFLRHYCVHLAGADHDRSRADFPADERAARGFNGDIARHARRWAAGSTGVPDGDAADAPALARGIARKTLLAVAGLVSMHDHTWTTDRTRGARRWSEIHPELAAGLDRLHDWVDREPDVSPSEIREIVDTAVCPIVEQFADRIGLWPDIV